MSAVRATVRRPAARGVRAACELLLILLVAWASLASSEDEGGGGGEGNGNGGGGTPTACDTRADCGTAEVTPCSGYNDCVAGLCVWKDPLDCSGLAGQNSCTSASCDPATGGCVLGSLPDGTWCEDANPCTQDDSCQSGRCVAGRPCGDDNPCMVATCDPVSGCNSEAAPEGTPCTPANACEVNGACDPYGSCRGVARDCDDGNPCTQDYCSGDGCENTPLGDGTRCDDGNPCTGPDICQSGVCDNGPVEEGTACDDANPCTGGSVCRAGACSAGTPIGDGGACDDADPCTNGTVCREGACTDGTAVTCDDDGNPCTLDTCEAGVGCTYAAVPLGTPCDTPPWGASECVVSFACEGTECAPTEVAENGTPCDDGQACTGGSICQSGSCVEGTPLGDGAACDDGNPCSTGGTCEGGVCYTTGELECPPGGPCGTGRCDPDLGCVVDPFPEGTGCDDSDPCTRNDVCRSGECVGIAFCDDGDPCTVDSCQGDLCVYDWEDSEECPQEANCTDRTDDDGDGRVDCAAPYCARMDEAACGTVLTIPTIVTFETGSIPGFGMTYDPDRLGEPAWAVDATPASPAAFSGTRTLNFNDDTQASWNTANALDRATAQLCCWDNGFTNTPVFVTWMEYVDLPTEEETAASDIRIERGFRFVRQEGGGGTQVTLPTVDGDRGQWRRRVVENPDFSEIGQFGVEWWLATPFEGWTGGAGWFIDDVEVLHQEQCDNDIDDNGNGDVDCDDALCEATEACP